MKNRNYLQNNLHKIDFFIDLWYNIIIIKFFKKLINILGSIFRFKTIILIKNIVLSFFRINIS